jgi:type IV fimbrial biogenesis protein FimT
MVIHTHSWDRQTVIKGLTLVELLVTIAVLGILLTIALPDLRSFVVSNRMSSDVNAFVGLVNYARSEAITRNQSVVICPKSDTAITCQNTQFWGQYEIQVFVDINDNGERNDPDDTLLKTIPAIDTTGLVRGLVRPQGAGKIIFRSVGYSSDTHRFNLWPKKPGDAAYEAKYGRAICITRPGRVRVIPYTATTCDAF